MVGGAAVEDKAVYRIERGRKGKIMWGILGGREDVVVGKGFSAWSKRYDFATCNSRG